MYNTQEIADNIKQLAKEKDVSQKQMLSSCDLLGIDIPNKSKSIKYSGNSQISEIEETLENGNILDGVIDFIYKAVESYK